MVAGYGSENCLRDALKGVPYVALISLYWD